jgi:hypothetical protein
MPATHGEFNCWCGRTFDTNTGATIHSLSTHGLPFMTAEEKESGLRIGDLGLTHKLPEHEIPEFTQIIVHRTDLGYETIVNCYWSNEVEPWIQDCLHRATGEEGLDMLVSKITIEHRDGGSETWLLTLDESR